MFGLLLLCTHPSSLERVDSARTAALLHQLLARLQLLLVFGQGTALGTGLLVAQVQRAVLLALQINLNLFCGFFIYFISIFDDFICKKNKFPLWDSNQQLGWLEVQRNPTALKKPRELWRGPLFGCIYFRNRKFMGNWGKSGSPNDAVFLCDLGLVLFEIWNRNGRAKNW